MCIDIYLPYDLSSIQVIRHHTAGVGQTTPTDRPSKSSNSSKKHSKDEAAASPKHNSARDEMTSFVQHVGGTRGYMAPELMRSANFTKACDVYGKEKLHNNSQLGETYSSTKKHMGSFSLSLSVWHRPTRTCGICLRCWRLRLRHKL